MTEKGSKGSVLIVDDTPANLEVLQDMLANSGYQLLIATSGEGAIKQAEYAQPDIILLDVMMPGIDGFETCRRFKETEATKDIPVIFMTALSETSDKIRGFTVGGVDYVTKPLQHEEVLLRVNTHLTIRNLQRELLQVNAGLERRVAERTAELTRLNAEMARKVAELEGIDLLVQIQMAPPTELSQAYEQILLILGQVTESGRVVIYRPDISGEILEPVAAMGLSESGRIDSGTSAEELPAVSLDDTVSPVAKAFVGGRALVSETNGVAPLLNQEEAVGVLLVGETITLHVDDATCSDREKALAKTLIRLGREAALALCVMQLADDMKNGAAEVQALLEE